MRRLVSIVLALVFGFGVGLAVENVWSRVNVTPYCTVAKNAEWYDGEFVRVRAQLFFKNDRMAVYEACDASEALAADVQFVADPSMQFVQYRDDSGVEREEKQAKKAEVIIEGRFNAHQSMGCFGPKFLIEAKKIQLVSDLHNAP